MSPTADREFDVVLLGATGFVGRLTAQHLAAHAPADLRIALAGRSTGRLSRLRDTLEGGAQDWPLITVNATDETAITSLVARTRVMASTVGPYLRHGLALVQACARAGTDYADLTGETLFVRQSIDTCHALARDSGARIVHSCGFDSVPSDLGVGLTAARAVADGAGGLAQTVLYLRSIKGGFSGGTIDSLRQQIIEVSADPQLRSQVSDPSCLVDGDKTAPTTPRAGGRRRRRAPIRRNGDTDHWQTPYVMGGFNRQIVLRSNALTDGGYGPEFRYREVVDTGRGPAGAARAAVIAGGSSAVMVGMWFKPTRWVLDRLLPDPGEGPSDRARLRGHFLMEVEAHTSSGAHYRTRIGASVDPGYDGAAIMLGESALSLATDALLSQGGVLTPMTAMGEALAHRLRSNGFTVTTERVDEDRI